MKSGKLFSAVLAAALSATLMSAAVYAESEFDGAISIDSGERVTEALDENDYVVYKLTAAESGTVRVRLSGASDLAYVDVYDEDGNTLNTTLTAGNLCDCDCGGICPNEGACCLRWSVTAGETYYVKITNDGCACDFEMCFGTSVSSGRQCHGGGHHGGRCR